MNRKKTGKLGGDKFSDRTSKFVSSSVYGFYFRPDKNRIFKGAGRPAGPNGREEWCNTFCKIRKGKPKQDIKSRVCPSSAVTGYPGGSFSART